MVIVVQTSVDQVQTHILHALLIVLTETQLNLTLLVGLTVVLITLDSSLHGLEAGIVHGQGVVRHLLLLHHILHILVLDGSELAKLDIGLQSPSLSLVFCGRRVECGSQHLQGGFNLTLAKLLPGFFHDKILSKGGGGSSCHQGHHH